MKILVVCQDYPSPASKSMMAFVHTRAHYFRLLGHDVSVLSFQAKQEYIWDDIAVYPEVSFSATQLEQFDICFLHAPNVRNGMRFMIRRGKRLKRLCLVIHGHEFLDWMSYVPKRFSYLRSFQTLRSDFMQAIYDKLKVRLWRLYLTYARPAQLKVIFVSKWMKEHSESSLGVNFDRLKIPNKIIHNPIHPAFAEGQYQVANKTMADFVTIRSFDEPKYAVDVVRSLALKHPDFTFHVYGQGQFFERFPAPSNLQVFKTRFKQTELPPLLNQYRCALLPTRLDAQGVLMCEIASLGMPIMVSDLSICKEMVGEFSNVGFFNNDNLNFSISVPKSSNKPPKEKFLPQNTVLEEFRFAAYTE